MIFFFSVGPLKMLCVLLASLFLVCNADLSVSVSVLNAPEGVTPKITGPTATFQHSVTIKRTSDHPEITLEYGLVLVQGTALSWSTQQDTTVCPVGAHCPEKFKVTFPNNATLLEFTFTVEQTMNIVCAVDGNFAVDFLAQYQDRRMVVQSVTPSDYTNVHVTECIDNTTIEFKDLHRCTVVLPFRNPSQTRSIAALSQRTIAKKIGILGKSGKIGIFAEFRSFGANSADEAKCVRK